MAALFIEPSLIETHDRQLRVYSPYGTRIVFGKRITGAVDAGHQSLARDRASRPAMASAEHLTPPEGGGARLL
jgi:hypothetical protein